MEKCKVPNCPNEIFEYRVYLGVCREHYEMLKQIRNQQRKQYLRMLNEEIRAKRLFDDAVKRINKRYDNRRR